MKAFFLFLGYALGFAFFAEEEMNLRLVILAVAILFFFLSFIKKQVAIFAISFLVGSLLGFLLSIARIPNQTEWKGVVIKRGENYFLLQTLSGKIYVSSSEHSYQIGDWLSIKGNAESIAMTSYESRFDFAAYLRRLGVHVEVRKPSISPLFTFPLRVVTWEQKYLKYYNETTSSLLSSILFYRKNQNSEVLALIEEMNLLYLFSASGIIFGKILQLFRQIILKFTPVKKKAEGILLVASLVFLPLGARKIGIAKVLMVQAVSFASLYSKTRKYTRLEILSVSALMQMVLSPYSIFQTGFVLSYGISFAFYFCGGSLNQTKSRFVNKVLSLLFVQFLVLPISMNGAGAFHLFGPLFSFLLTPLLFPFALLGLLGYLSFPLPSLLNPYGDFLFQAMKLCSTVDYKFAIPIWGPWLVLIYYLALFLFLFGSELHFPSLQKGVATSFFLMHTISLLPVVAPFTQGVYFINVGQGDAILIRDRLTTVLLDTGGNLHFDMAKEVLIPFFWKERIYHIDALIASHHDYDHIGAKESLEDNFDVRSFIDEASSFPLQVGDLHFSNFNAFPAQEENDASLVLKLDFMGKKWLFTGDAPEHIEKKILEEGHDVDCDILKVGHHGSNTSTCMEFLQATTPLEAVVSVGRKNSYGHPSSEVLNRLSSQGIKIRRTDLEGTIRYAKWVSPWV